MTRSRPTLSTSPTRVSRPQRRGHRSHGAGMRVLAALALACALTIAPSAAFADTFTGTPGSDDTITGGDGEDFVDGDGTVAGGGNLEGGDDTINGDGDDDQIYGDGAAYNDG